MFNASPPSIWARRWLMLAVLALAISGLFSLILVFARTPQLIALVPFLAELFSVALVIHVDLSVLVWFLAMAGLCFSLLPRRFSIPYADAAAWGCVLVAVLCMSFSPLTGEWEVIKANYIPVITNGVFSIGLALLLAGMVIALLQACLARVGACDALQLGVLAMIPMLLVAIACFVASHAGIPEGIIGLAFYEHLFWAGGHVLQFAYVQLMLLAWVVLARINGYTAPPRLMLLGCLLFGAVASFTAIIPYALYDVMSQEHMDAFSLQMNLALGVAGGILGLWYGWQLCAGACSCVPFLPRMARC
jgi:cytochrome c oxidase subunit I